MADNEVGNGSLARERQLGRLAPDLRQVGLVQVAPHVMGGLQDSTPESPQSLVKIRRP